MSCKNKLDIALDLSSRIKALPVELQNGIWTIYWRRQWHREVFPYIKDVIATRLYTYTTPIFNIYGTAPLHNMSLDKCRYNDNNVTVHYSRLTYDDINICVQQQLFKHLPNQICVVQETYETLSNNTDMHDRVYYLKSKCNPLRIILQDHYNGPRYDTLYSRHRILNKSGKVIYTKAEFLKLYESFDEKSIRRLTEFYKL